MKTSAGIALLEVLLSVVLLSAGLIAVYQPLLASVSAMDYLDYRVESRRLIANFIWNVTDAAVKTRTLPAEPETGTLMGGRRVVRYRAAIRPLTKDSALSQLDVTVFWQAGGRKRELTHALYLALPYEAPK